MPFATEITLTGPMRSPAQMCSTEVGGHASVHAAAEAAHLVCSGAPIEDPRTSVSSTRSPWRGEAHGSSGLHRSHFRTMVVEGEECRRR
jgi:hypothetical protein